MGPWCTSRRKAVAAFPSCSTAGCSTRLMTCASPGIAQELPAEEFRPIYVDHRGLGRSDKPHDPAAYVMAMRVEDAVAVLDELGIERAHFVGMSWGGRLGFGIGEHASERVLSLIIGGQQPYEWPDSPITRVVTQGLSASRTHDTEGLVEAFEAFWGVRFPDDRRARWVDNDPAALQAAWTTALAEGPISNNLPLRRAHQSRGSPARPRSANATSQ